MPGPETDSQTLGETGREVAPGSQSQQGIHGRRPAGPPREGVLLVIRCGLERGA